MEISWQWLHRWIWDQKWSKPCPRAPRPSLGPGQRSQNLHLAEISGISVAVWSYWWKSRFLVSSQGTKESWRPVSVWAGKPRRGKQESLRTTTKALSEFHDVHIIRTWVVSQLHKISKDMPSQPPRSNKSHCTVVARHILFGLWEVASPRWCNVQRSWQNGLPSVLGGQTWQSDVLLLFFLHFAGIKSPAADQFWRPKSQGDLRDSEWFSTRALPARWFWHILTWPGWVTFSVPFRREMISKKTSGTATRDLGFVVTTSTRHRWQVLPSVEWLSDTFSNACRPVFPKKNNEVYTASTRHWTSKIFMSEKGGKLWPEINHEELELPSFLSRAKWHPVTRNHQMHRAMAARSCGQVGYIKWYFNTSSNLPTSKLTIATIIYDNLTIAMITIYSCHNPWSDCKWLRSRTRVYIAAWYIKKIVQSTCINRWSSNPQDPLNPL